jgi:hypothetical protein
MKAKEYQYELKIKRTAKAGLDVEEYRNLSGLRVEFSAENDPMIFDSQGNVTGYGYKVAVNTLCSAISEYSRAIKEIGGNEGEVIKDAINQLKKNLVSIERKPPKQKTVTRKFRHKKKDKPNKW